LSPLSPAPVVADFAAMRGPDHVRDAGK